MNLPMQWTVEGWQVLALLVTLLLAFLACMLQVGKFISKQIGKALDVQFAAQNKQIDRIEGDGKELNSRFSRLEANLPREYVQREDWVRLASTLDAKLDRLNQRDTETQQMITESYRRRLRGAGSGDARRD